MLIKDIFETQMQGKIDATVNLGEWQDEKKLSSDIGRYVVTPAIIGYCNEFLQHYSEFMPTTEIGCCIYGEEGSGKSHLAKMLTLLAKNQSVGGKQISDQFDQLFQEPGPQGANILNSLLMLSECDTKVMALNLNALAESKTTPLFRFLLTQYYISKGYSNNLFYARVIEAELDKRGKLSALHQAAEEMTKQPWSEIQKKLGFYAKYLYEAAYKVAPEVFSSPDEVAKAIKNMMSQALKVTEEGGLFNVNFLIRTILEDLEAHKNAIGKPSRLVLILDELTTWLGEDPTRPAQFQELISEIANTGLGSIWVIATGNENIETLYEKMHAEKTDAKAIGKCFKHNFQLTKQSIDAILKSSLLKKKPAVRETLASLYAEKKTNILSLAGLKKANQKIEGCDEEQFIEQYPFLPYQLELIPKILRNIHYTNGGIDKSVRALPAIVSDIISNGRRKYLTREVGEIVSFDDVYENFVSEGEIPAETQREINRIEAVVSDATSFTKRIGEVLYLISNADDVPRTVDNIAKLIAEKLDDDLEKIARRIQPELDRLVEAKIIMATGDQYEFLTGERRLFEENIQQEIPKVKAKDVETAMSGIVNSETLGVKSVLFKGYEFPVRTFFDNNVISQEGKVDVRIYSPMFEAKLADLEVRSHRTDEEMTIFILCQRDAEFDQLVKYFIAMQRVAERWSNDSTKPEDSRKMVGEWTSAELKNINRKILLSIHNALGIAHVIFRGQSIQLMTAKEQNPFEVIREALSEYWSKIYSKLEKAPVRIEADQRAVIDVLLGSSDMLDEVKELGIYNDKGQIDLQAPLIEAICTCIFTRQSKRERTLGSDIVTEFSKPPYGWDESAVRVGVAALVRAGTLKVNINRKSYQNPMDPELQDALRGRYSFENVELTVTLMSDVHKFLTRLTGRSKIEETPEELAKAFMMFGKGVTAQAGRTIFWAEKADLPLPLDVIRGKDAVAEILKLENPLQKVAEIYTRKERIESYVSILPVVSGFADNNARAYEDMRGFARAVCAAEHRLKSGGPAHRFVKLWNEAYEVASIMDDKIWKQLQQYLKEARNELNDMVSSWRKEAEKMIKEAIQSVPKRLAEAELPVAEFSDQLVQPLKDFADSVYFVQEPTKVAGLLDTAQKLVSDIETVIKTEIERRDLEKQAKEEIRRRAEEEARRRATEAQAAKVAEEQARKRAVEEARRRAEEQAKKRAQDEARQHAEAEARKRAQEEARRRIEEGAKLRQKAEEEARKRAEDEAKRRAEEEVRRRIEAETRKRVEEEAKRRAVQEERKRAEEQAKQQADNEARKRAEEQAAKTEATRRQAEAEAAKQADEVAATTVKPQSVNANGQSIKYFYIGSILTMFPLTSVPQWELVCNFLDQAVKLELSNGVEVRLGWSEAGAIPPVPASTGNVKCIQVGPIASLLPIQGIAQWDLVRNFLDQAVKLELSNGNEVKLTW